MKYKKEPSNRESFSLKMPVELKKRLENEAYTKGYSLNAYILMKLGN